MNKWIDNLVPIINSYADGNDLDDNDIEDLSNIIKAKIRLHLGKITEDEYEKITAIPYNNTTRIVNLEETLRIIRDDAEAALNEKWNKSDSGFQAQIELIDGVLDGGSVADFQKLLSELDAYCGNFFCY